jgi:uncharacterized membrane protein
VDNQPIFGHIKLLFSIIYPVLSPIFQAIVVIAIVSFIVSNLKKQVRNMAYKFIKRKKKLIGRGQERDCKKTAFR